jgi:hypothetical protein
VEQPFAPKFIRRIFDLRLVGDDQEIELVLARSLASSSPIPVEASVTTASLRWDSGIGCLLHARLQDDLDAAVLLVAETLVKLGPLLKRGGVRDDE